MVCCTNYQIVSIIRRTTPEKVAKGIDYSHNVQFRRTFLLSDVLIKRPPLYKDSFMYSTELNLPV